LILVFSVIDSDQILAKRTDSNGIYANQSTLYEFKQVDDHYEKNN